ncbi:MAG: tetratricopeptide repeat protein [Hyphomicrobiales bacterium]
MRVERVVERLNGEFAGIARLEAIRWEGKHYKAHATFQQQIPEASACDVVIAILRHRLGTELPEDFPAMSNGEPYPSGTAYEILSAIEASKEKAVPDVYVFRFGEPPTVKLDDESTNRLVTDQWEKLKTFFKKWFQTSDGKFKLAFHTFQNTDTFEEEIDKLLRTWLEEKILKGRSVLWPVDIKGSPFRGLASFGAKHAPVFFGRSRDITKAVDGLKEAGERGAPFQLVVGASGAGKSSLALAGLVPRITAPGVVSSVDIWRVAVMRPGESPDGPLASLAERLFDTATDLEDECPLPALPELAESDYATPADLTTLFNHADDACAKPIVRALDRVAETEAKASGFDREVRADLLIVIDQLDELFASRVSDEARERFIKVIDQLVATGRVWVITTLRADLYEQFLKEPGLLALKGKGATYDLAPPGATEIDEIIRGPAAAAGLVYETDPKTGERLDDRLLRDIDRPDMLPLLQFTLNFLFEKRVTEDGETKLTLKAYDELGGLAGAIDREGERAMAGLGQDEQERLPRLLRQLATPAPTAEVGSAGATAGLSILSVPFTAAAYDPSSERLVRALVDARILMSSGGEHDATIRLAHQRVLENWKRAKEIVAANAEFYRIRDDVERLRGRWEKAKKARDLLIPKGVPLAEAESIAKRYPDELAPPTLGFIAASGKRARFRQRLIGVAAVVFAFLAVGATVAGVLALQAERRAKRNFDVASNLVTDIARGLRNVEGMTVESRQKIFAQVSETLDSAVEESPDDAQLLGMQEFMFKEFASTHEEEGEEQQAAENKAKMLEIQMRLKQLNASSDPYNRQKDIPTLEQIGDLKLKAADDVGALAVYEELLANRRKVVESNGGSVTDQLRDVAATLDTIGDLKLRAGDLDGALEAYNEALTIRREVLARDKSNAAWQQELASAVSAEGYAKQQIGDAAGALTDYEETLKILEGPVDAGEERNLSWNSDMAYVLVSIGNVKLDTGDTAGAVEAYQKSLDLRRRLAKENEGNSWLWRDMSASLTGVGDAKQAQNDLKGALEAFDESAAILRDLVADDPYEPWQRDLSISLNRVGDVKRDLGDAAGALAAYGESLRIRQALAQGDEDNTQAQMDEIYVLQRLGDVKRNEADYSGALEAFERSLAIARKLAEKEPDSVVWQREVSIALSKVGMAKKGAGDSLSALEALEESIEIRRKLPQTDRAKWQLDVAENLEPIGDLKLAAGDKEGAIAAYEEMLGYDRELTASDPENLQWQRNLSISLNRLGDVKKKVDDPEGALAAYEESLVIRRKLLEAGKTISRQQDVALNLEKIGDIKRDAGDTAAASRSMRRCLALTATSRRSSPTSPDGSATWRSALRGSAT